MLPAAGAAQHAVTIRDVRSGTAMLRQHGRLTILEIKPHAGSSLRIALSHPSDYRQGTDGPTEAHLVAENPDHFVIFTDTSPLTLEIFRGIAVQARPESASSM